MRVGSISKRSTAIEWNYKRRKRSVDARCSAVVVVKVHFIGNKNRILGEVHFYQHMLGEARGKCPLIWWKMDKIKRPISLIRQIVACRKLNVAKQNVALAGNDQVKLT